MNWLRRLLPGRSPMTVLYDRARRKAEERDWDGALTDYTTVIEGEDVKPELRAMALVNRALAYTRTNQHEAAIGDLERVLAMKNAPPAVRAAAKEKLNRITKRITSR